MPQSRIRKPPMTLPNLREGDEVFVTFTEIVVDQKDGSTYVSKKADARDQARNTVKIRRSADGYHLTIWEKDTDFRPTDINDWIDLIPIETITEQAALENAPAQTGTKMIPSRIEQPVTYLSDVADTEAEVDIWAAGVAVDEKDGSTYIHRDAKVTSRGNPIGVRIRRGVDGYRVIILEESTKFRPKQITDYSKLIPVVEVIEELRIRR